MAMYTTKRLAAVMGVTPGTVLDWGRRLCWPHKNNLYGSGITWNVTDEQITEYFEMKQRSNMTREQKLDRAWAMFERWDVAFSGRKFPRNIYEIDMSKWRVAYTNMESEERRPIVAPGQKPIADATRCSRVGCTESRMPNADGRFYAYCRAHHNERQRAAGRKHRLKKKAQLLAEKINALNYKKELTSNI